MPARTALTGPAASDQAPVARKLARARGRYRTKLVVGALLLGVVPLALVGWLAVRTFRRSLEDQVRERLYSAIDDVALRVDGELRDTQHTLEVLADFLADASVPPATRIERATTALAANQAVGAVAVYDSEHTLIDTLRKPGDGSTVAPHLPASWVRQTGRLVGAPQPNPDGARLPIGLTFSPPGAAQPWVLVAHIALEPLADRLGELAEQRFEGHPDALWVLDRELAVVANADPEQLGRTASLATSALFRGDRTAEAVLRDLAQGSSRSTQTLSMTQYQGPRGTMVAAIRTLPSAPLLLVAQLSYQHAFAAVLRMRRAVVALVAIAAALSALIGIGLARRMSRPVARLVDYAGALAVRDFNAPLDLHTNDELEVLGDALTGAAHAIVVGEERLREEQAIRADLGRYLPEQLVDRVVARRQSLMLGGARQPVTVLFADVAGFTALVEAHPPEIVATVLNQLFTLLTEIVFRHEGTVDKFIGDCVMAFWNAPEPRADHAARAVKCAREMLRWLEAANQVWEQTHGLTVHLAIGVHTGEAVVGNFGSATRMEYTCIGDTVNVAARLEHLARPQQILGSAELAAAAPTSAVFLPLGKTALPGRQQPIVVYEIAEL